MTAPICPNCRTSIENRDPETPEPLRGLRVERIVCPEAPYGCVYFLLRAGVVVYIGQSIDVYARVSTHRRGGCGQMKQFDDVWIIPIAPAYLDSVEGVLIRKFKPEYNHGRNGRLHFPDRGSPRRDKNALARAESRPHGEPEGPSPSSVILRDEIERAMKVSP